MYGSRQRLWVTFLILLLAVLALLFRYQRVRTHLESPWSHITIPHNKPLQTMHLYHIIL